MEHRAVPGSLAITPLALPGPPTRLHIVDDDDLLPALLDEPAPLVPATRGMNEMAVIKEFVKARAFEGSSKRLSLLQLEDVHASVLQALVEQGSLSKTADDFGEESYALQLSQIAVGTLGPRS
eukprot:10797196-Lingulodinium_polyedra.AAC.1